MQTRASPGRPEAAHDATHLLRQMEEDMATISKDIRDPEPARAQRGPRIERRTAANAPEFAAPEIMLDEPGHMLAAWSTARWVEEQEALAAAAVRRASAPARRVPDFRPARLAARRAARRPGNWLLRFEAALHRLLPGGLGSLLGLFLCVTLSMALISSMLPVVDRL
jgi:hypothetical protein